MLACLIAVEQHDHRGLLDIPASCQVDKVWDVGGGPGWHNRDSVQVQRVHPWCAEGPQVSGTSRKEHLVSQPLYHQVAIADKCRLTDKSSEGGPKRLVVIFGSIVYNAGAFVIRPFFENTDSLTVVAVDQEWGVRHID